ncbi:MAG TPA: SOS response-associated peptidase family protein, partial [Burkholderiales bacterium]|nr:SOS response-associated peptidase family protein [Burkholderiales bacterium]
MPASGYYEWQPVAGRKQPWYIRPADAPLFGFAGIYTLHRTEQGDAGTVASLTTGANASTRDIPDRMPVIVRPEDCSRRLDPAVDTQAFLALPGPYAPERVACYPVSPRV